MRIRVRFLSVLAQHLEKIEALPSAKRRREFDMNDWLTKRVSTVQQKTVCGTAACALGEACFIPLLKHAGLKLSSPHRTPAVRKTFSLYRTPMIVRGKGRGHYGGAAAMQLFGISASTADFLFMPDGSSNDTPGKVAARIRRVIAAELAVRQRAAA